ncbi:MAG: hypothetical protein WCH39_04775 [Schlesneria sp.]
MTDPLSKYWEQPSRDGILLDDHYALMDTCTFDKLKNYSRTVPSGVYPGKMWKAQCHESGEWFLRWYGWDDGDPRGLPTLLRKIIVI